MARKRYTPEQIVAILRDAERSPSQQEVFRKHGISNQTFYRWRKMYGGPGVSEVRRIKELEEEIFCSRGECWIGGGRSITASVHTVRSGSGRLPKSQSNIKRSDQVTLNRYEPGGKATVCRAVPSMESVTRFV